ncbi:hypothetical protein PA18A_2951 [Pseudomonas aeruginosa 18A]|nr:hypothetical protein PA18A_2951 [Pseudomonas aeruginosa 18A]
MVRAQGCGESLLSPSAAARGNPLISVVTPGTDRVRRSR